MERVGDGNDVDEGDSGGEGACMDPYIPRDFGGTGGLAGVLEGVKWAANLELRVGGDTLIGGKREGKGGSFGGDDDDAPLWSKIVRFMYLVGRLGI